MIIFSREPVDLQTRTVTFWVLGSYVYGWIIGTTAAWWVTR